MVWGKSSILLLACACLCNMLTAELGMKGLVVGRESTNKPLKIASLFTIITCSFQNSLQFHHDTRENGWKPITEILVI